MINEIDLEDQIEGVKTAQKGDERSMSVLWQVLDEEEKTREPVSRVLADIPEFSKRELRLLKVDQGMRKHMFQKNGVKVRASLQFLGPKVSDVLSWTMGSLVHKTSDIPCLWFSSMSEDLISRIGTNMSNYGETVRGPVMGYQGGESMTNCGVVETEFICVVGSGRLVEE